MQGSLFRDWIYRIDKIHYFILLVEILKILYILSTPGFSGKARLNSVPRPCLLECDHVIVGFVDFVE
jgi:hypothetical protein